MKLTKKMMHKYVVQMKPCPFCGGKAEMLVGELAEPYGKVLEDGERIFVGACRTCGTQGPTVASDDPAHGVEAWNRRV